VELGLGWWVVGLRLVYSLVDFLGAISPVPPQAGQILPSRVPVPLHKRHGRFSLRVGDLSGNVNLLDCEYLRLRGRPERKRNHLRATIFDAKISRMVGSKGLRWEAVLYGNAARLV
jgi:hypothetical protein